LTSSLDLLGGLQRSVLDGLSGAGDAFYLSGGAALADRYLCHRRCASIDLFVPTLEGVAQIAGRLEALAAAEGWCHREVDRYRSHRRWHLQRGTERTAVDITFDPGPHVVVPASKPPHRGIRVDALEDIVAGKLCALQRRAQTRDLVDLFFVERCGLEILEQLRPAAARDEEIEPATLAHQAAGVSLETDQLQLVRPVRIEALRDFRAHLVRRLLLIAWPGGWQRILIPRSA